MFDSLNNYSYSCRVVQIVEVDDREGLHCFFLKHMLSRFAQSFDLTRCRCFRKKTSLEIAETAQSCGTLLFLQSSVQNSLLARVKREHF